MLSQLRRTLDKRHRLVRAQGSQQIGPGGQRLSQYRFRHILFQKYLYESLDEAEHAYWHQAVGTELEQLYAEQADSIAPQLARHYQAAGLVSKAIDYMQKAGDAASDVYAHAEAVAHYARALELTKLDEASSQELIHLYTRLGRSLELNAQFDQALTNYEEKGKLAQQRSDRPLELSAMMARGTLYATPTPLHEQGQGEVLNRDKLL